MGKGEIKDEFCLTTEPINFKTMPGRNMTHMVLSNFRQEYEHAKI